MDSANLSSVISPELLGPVFKVENVSLRQALYNNNTNRRFRILATFVPDQLIYSIENKLELHEIHFVVLLFLDISGLYSLFDEFCNAQNNGSSGLSKIFNLYTSAIIEQICFNGGDVLKFTDNGILSMWKQNGDELVHEVMRRVISCSFAIKEAMQHFESDFLDLSKAHIKSAISAGSVTFAVIGDSDAGVQHYIIAGNPVNDVKKAIKVSIPSDLILAESAWEHCILCDYVYVIQDKSHIKITKELKKSESMQLISDKKSVELICKPEVEYKTLMQIPSHHDLYSRKAIASDLKRLKNRKCVAILQNRETEKQIIASRQTILDTCKSQLGVYLKKFLVKAVLDQIENDLPLAHLTEMKNITVVLIEVSPVEECSSAAELIILSNRCHSIILKNCENVGCIESVSLHDRNIIFRIVFGICNYQKHSNHCQFGILCAKKLLHSLKHMSHVEGVSVGVSTGLCCCTVIGHIARRHYVIIGPPLTKAKNMMLISHDMVSCDLNTLMYSGLKKSDFLSSGLINLRGFEKGYVFGFYNKDVTDNPDTSDLKNAFPILDRSYELELFSDILDDIGVLNRTYSGIIIEGDRRIGKSRVLDAFCSMAKARQIGVVKLVLHTSFAAKPYSVIYKILEQILEIDDCKTIDELEKNITNKLGDAIDSSDLCYMNKILHVRFKLSHEYIADSDWNRHRKCISIFKKILKVCNERRCILLDNVQYMDYMSWQFLTHAINNKNIVLAMTILETQSWGDLSRAEVDICKDKRLLRHTLPGLQPGFLPTLACQFLDVQGISVQLHNFIMNIDITHPGWYELFLTLIDLCGGFDFVTLTADEAAQEDFIFPEMLLVTRISADLFPDETAPLLPWHKRDNIFVCVVNEKFKIAESFKSHDLHGLASEIYARLSMYEQDVAKCATVIGKVFARSALEKIIPNHQSLKTATAIENLMRLRIFECAALQRRSTKVGDLAVCSFKPRSTFSDMHHLLRCRCHSSYIPPAEKNLELYAHCRFMEFKVSVFQNVVYQQIGDDEKKELHTQVVDIYKKDARKCTACGSGSFLRIPGKEKSRKSIKPSIPIVTSNLEHPALNSLSNRETDIHGISIMRTSFVADESHEIDEGDATSKRKTRMRQLIRKTRVHPAEHENSSPTLNLTSFGHIDFRNCRCMSIIDCIFMKLQQHIEYIDNNDKVIQFMMEYGAALIEYGEPSYALRFLAKADERNDFINTYDAWKNPVVYYKMVKKSIILCLRGNAYMLLGNYPQARTSYMEALSLFKPNFSASGPLTCCKTLYEEIRQTVLWTFTYPALSDEDRYERDSIVRQNTASCLRLVSSILMINYKNKAAKLTALQSVVFGFASYYPGTFYDQCQVYISIVKVYGQLGDLTFLGHVEKYMLFAINNKRNWQNSDDIAMLAHVYFAMFNVSLLRGRLERAPYFGEKSLRIANAFHMIRLEFDILPSLILVLIRLKRVCEAMDMLQQLRDTAYEDVDKSAVTWYYALCMDLLLDAAILIESYEVCASHAHSILVAKSQACVLRDPRGLKRLVIGLWAWKLRKGDLTSSIFVKDLDFYTTDFEFDNYLEITTLCKVLECHLILLTRYINMKKGALMEMLNVEVEKLMKILDDAVKVSQCLEPHYYLLKAYYNLLHGRKFVYTSYLRRANKSAREEKNLLALAWISRNKHTWKAVSYNNMASYWEENIGYQNTIVWQDVDMFDLNDWSNLLYSLPVPDSYI